MKKLSSTIVFFGSGPVAAKSLELLNNNFLIEAVITKPKKLHHHGNVPVIDLANKINIKTYLASNKLELEEIFKNNIFTSEIAILIDYGIIISQNIIDYFSFGIINSHFSILPEWRGPDPITFSILSGQSTTGVSLMKLVSKMDEGPLLAWSDLKLSREITTPQLTDQLIQLSDHLINQYIPLYLKNNLPLKDQSITGKNTSYSKKITKDDGLINVVDQTAESIERQVRAFIDWPKSKIRFRNTDLIITSCEVKHKSGKAGDFFIYEKNLAINCQEDSLVLLEIIPAGRKKMSSKDFLIGQSIKQL